MRAQRSKTKVAFLILLGIVALLIINAIIPIRGLLRWASKSNQFRLDISDPVIVAQASPDDEKIWGVFQYPRLCYTDGEKILMMVANKPDSVTSYSGQYLYYLSEDQGSSWRESNEGDSLADLSLSMENGRYYQGPQLKDAYYSDEMENVQPFFRTDSGNISLYRLKETSMTTQEFMASEYDVSTGTVTEFPSRYLWQKASAVIKDGLMMPSGWWLYLFKMHTPNSIIKEENGSLLAATYGWGGVIENTEYLEKYNVCFLRSEDNGRSWKYVSSIIPDGVCDEESIGLCEPCLTVAPDGRYFVLMRSGEVEPCYYSYSMNRGQTWEKPREFDWCGVAPQLLTLDCGVTLASYGRPGVYVKATDDPKCMPWKRTVEINLCEEHEGYTNLDTCGYTSLIALDRNTALLAYSDFNYPFIENPNKKVKTILVRKIKVNYTY